MENITQWLAAYSQYFYILLGIGITVLIWLIVPAKKPKSRGTLFVIHYPNDFKELYLKLEDDIENFEYDRQVCFDVRIEDRSE